MRSRDSVAKDVMRHRSLVLEREQALLRLVLLVYNVLRPISEGRFGAFFLVSMGRKGDLHSESALRRSCSE